jgi:RNA polymerase sigma-70 factor (sigma-E family)
LDLLQKKNARVEFERFVRREMDGLMRTAFLITWDLADAEDLVQDCLLRVARRWPKVRAMEHSAAYTRRVLVNLALDDSIKRRRRQRELQDGRGAGTDMQDLDGAVDGRGSLETRDELLRAIGTLPPRQRTVLVLRFFEDLTEAQVAEMLGCSLGTVKSTTARGLARVREALQPSSQLGVESVNQHEGGSIHDRSA